MASAGGGNAAFEVSMIPEDYKRLSPEVIAKIKPLTDDPETTDTRSEERRVGKECRL